MSYRIILGILYLILVYHPLNEQTTVLALHCILQYPLAALAVLRKLTLLQYPIASSLVSFK